MKILLIDLALDGHHLSYLESLIEAIKRKKFDVSIVIPDSCSFSSEKSNLFQKVNVYKSNNCRGRELNYFKWIKELKAIANKEKPDIIHFVYGDALYRYFAWKINKIYLNAKVIVTCHQVRRSILRDLSYKIIGKKCSAIIVHTRKLLNDFNSIGITNVFHIEYPQFDKELLLDKSVAKEKLGIKSRSEKIILALGGTRHDKGLDILLEALKEIKEPFCLIVAGKESTFKREFIEEKTASYKERVILLLNFLSKEKMELCINAADIVVLPYRRTFDGASGPLGEGVWCYKEIIGSSHKSLGMIIENNHLGKTFESENVEDLRRILVESLKIDWEPDEAYRAYREALNPVIFQKKYIDIYKHFIEKIK